MANAEQIVLVRANLNARTRQLTVRGITAHRIQAAGRPLEIDYTPKRGRRLNMPRLR